jgi:asparagine synthase (glutamine-hydrolysing)
VSLTLEGRVVRDRLTDALRSYDQPSYDGINTYFISMLVRQAGIKVALSGLGGDELFVGYGGFAKGLRFEHVDRLLAGIPAGWRELLSRRAAEWGPPGAAASGAVAELLSPDLAAPYFASRILFCRRRAEKLLEPDWRPAVRGPRWQQREAGLARAARGLTPLDRVSFFELQTYLVSTLLRDADQMSMAHGLELRVPLIDPEVVEHVLPIPAVEKAPPGSNKRLLRHALGGMVPAEVFARRKRGFLLPFRRWLAEDLQGRVQAVFLSEQPRGPWSVEEFRRVWRNFRRGRITWSRVLPLFILENWLEQNGVTA